VRVLPEPSGHDDAPEPLPSFAPLLDAARTTGTRVEVVEQGTPIPVSQVVGRTVYRLVQEGLTNVRKHAAGAPTQLSLTYGDDGLTVSIRSSTATAPPDPALTTSGSGTGLLGLRRRIELIGGSFTAGQCPNGGFELRAELPGQPGR
jgi:signal transduction histidine kinase